MPITGNLDQENPTQQDPGAQDGSVDTLDNAPASDAALDNAPASDAALDNAPVSDASLDNAPVLDAALDNAPVSDAALDNAPVLDAALDNAPVSDAALDNAPVSDAALDNAPVSDAALDNAPVSDAALDNAPVSDAALDNAPVSDAALGNAPVSDAALDSGQVQALDTNGAEVSSTTTDLEATAGVSHASEGGEVTEPVESTSAMEPSSESVDNCKDEESSQEDSEAKLTSSTSSSSAVLSRGFQDAFAAFASAPYRDEDEDTPMDVSGDGTENVSEPNGDTIVSAAADSVTSSAAEPLVSSAIDSGLVTTSGQSLVKTVQETDVVQSTVAAADMMSSEPEEEQQQMETAESGTESHPVPEGGQPVLEGGQLQEAEQITQMTDIPSSESQSETNTANDSVYFIQMTDASGQVVTSIIDPNDIPSYADSVVYKQCMKPDGEIETTIVYSGGMPVPQEEPQEQPAMAVAEETEPQQGEQQIIYAHDLNGQLTPIDSAQSANDVAPPGKQFVYMQDSTGRIIRTIMDANQTMVPGQQVYYTQSEDGRIITSVMDSAAAGMGDESAQQQQQETVEQVYQQPDQLYQQQQVEDSILTSQQQVSSSAVVGGTASFNIDNSMSGLSMLAELSHLTAGQAPTASGLPSTEPAKTASSTDSNSMDMDEFRPVAMVTRRVAGEEGVETVNSDMAELKVGETDSDTLDQGSSLLEGDDATGQEESQIAKIVSQMKGELAHPSYTVSRDNLFVQWQNLDAMCWMDVVLIMLVYSPTLRPLVNLEATHELSSTLLITLLKANRQAQILLQNLLKKSNGAEISGLQTGAGNIATMQDPKSSKLVCKENMDEIGKAINILYAMREKIWQALQPRLRCERGKHNSPVLVLPLLVREKPAIKQMFTMNYRYVFKCEQCGYSQDDSHTKILPSIPAVPADFNMKAPCFVRNCFECQAPNQRMLMKFEGLQDFVQMHFVKGLPHNRFEELSFDFNDDHYEVTAVVHYKNNPDHFIAWVRNAPGPAWMECDDLKSVITRYQHVPPNIPPSQVHMVMWERRLTPQHTLVMRDTEDTKLLASLVLTVQQPNTHQSTDPAARPTGAPSAPALPSTSLIGAPTSASTLLSGLVTQSQSFSPYTPRGGRGRGRGSRGSYGGRGRGATITATPTIRRVTPVTGVSSPTITASPRGRGTPQIVRLPLSALAGSGGLGLRGSSPGTTKYVLVGGNSSQSGSTISTQSGSAPSKVVVVRSQGGSGNISATQLLQLLQRSGAISQSGAKITTTITSSGSTTASSSASYIVQQDGTVITTTTPTTSTETTTSQALSEEAATSSEITDAAEPGQMEETSMVTESSLPSANEQASEAPHQKLVTETPSGPQFISTLAFPAPVTTTVEQMSVSDSIVVSPEPGTSLTTMQSTAVSASTSDVEVTGEQPAPGAKTVTLAQGQQQPSRYIQIPNPAGGGTLLCQLVMRGGKMVLVPVDKNTQAQVTGGPSVLKLPGTPGSPSSTGSSPKITIRAPVSSPQIVSLSSAGAVLAQLQQQQQQQQQQAQSTISLSPVSTASSATTTTAVTTTASPRFITLPGASGGKRTIQLITVPRGANTTQASQAGKTIIMSGSSQALSTTPTSRLITSGDASNAEGRILSQSGNIVIRELKKSDADSTTTLSASVGNSGLGLDDGTGHLTSTPAVSLLRDVSARSGMAASSGMTSLLTSPPASQQQKPQESFRYILPGNNTTHILHTGASASQGGVGQTGKAFTALSSSGTIIGGQLTPAASAGIGTSMDQDLILADSDDSNPPASNLTAQRRISREMDTTEYIPLGRGRAKTRGGRGRGRGGRTPRGGRGRGQAWGKEDTQYVPPAHLTSQKMSALNELRQIGAHVIESGSEAVDGVPVLSIPDFSSDRNNQSEAISAAQSLLSETAENTADHTSAIAADASSQITSPTVDQENLSVSESAAGQGPRVITQPIPSIKANHGFDILTQGILGAGNTSRSSAPAKQARSLLTGATTTLPSVQSASTLLASLSASTAPTLSDGSPPLSSSDTQAELDTLIEAADSAAKPTKPGSKSPASSMSPKHKSRTSSLFAKDTSPRRRSSEKNSFAMGDIFGGEVENGTNVESGDAGVEPARRGEEEDREGRVMSVDESQVSAAERYRMPMELFQPDEESPEKSLKGEDSEHKMGVELPTKLFQDSEVSSHEDERGVSVSPQHPTKLAVKPQPVEEAEPPEASSAKGSDVDIETEATEDQAGEQVPAEGLPQVKKRKGGWPKGKSRSRSGKRGGRRKSSTATGVEEQVESEKTESALPGSPMDTSGVVSPKSSFDEKIAQIISSPKRESTQHSADTSPGKQPAQRSTSVGGFATDVLMDTEGEEVQAKHDNLDQDKDTKAVNDSQKASARTRGRKEKKVDIQTEEKIVPESKDIKDSVEKLSEEIMNSPLQPIAVNLDKQKEIVKQVVRKRVIYYPAFVRHSKEKADWSIEISDDEELDERHIPFSYCVLTRKATHRSIRHPSLGPREQYFISPPPSFSPIHTKINESTAVASPAVVKRRSPKPLEKPMADPSKESTVIPLVAEDDSDPACMGGSVVTSPLDREIFTGVLVRHKQQTADWSCVLEDDGDNDVDENLSGEDLKSAQRRYCKQLLTVLYMDAGDFSSAVLGADSDEEEEEEEVEVGEEGSIKEEAGDSVDGERPMRTVDGAVMNSEDIGAKDAEVVREVSGVGQLDGDMMDKTPASVPQVKQKKRGRPRKDSLATSHPAKRARSSQDEGTASSMESGDDQLRSPAHSVSSLELDSAINTSAAAPPTRVNGIDTASSPAHLPQTSSDAESGQSFSHIPAAAAMSSFPSPSRRSGRTPIPSKRVLDAWEDAPVRTSHKAGRRSSLVSSDEEFSGYSSGDAPLKKQKKNQPIAPS